MDSIHTVINPATENLAASKLQLYRGWNDETAAQLVALSRQPHIIEFTPNDAKRRFATVEAAHAWHSEHDRIVYTLGQSAIAGLIWFGHATSPHTEGEYTFAIRMYESTRGRGLAQPFMLAAHQDFRETSGYDGSIWLETDTTNTVARTLYERAGYRVVTTVEDRIVMSLDD